MFSTDKNIETLAQLIKAVKDYVGLQSSLLQLNAVTKAAQVLTLLLLFIILSFFLLLIIIFLSFAAAFALSEVMPTALAFLCVTGFYALILIIVLSKKETWIQRPLIHFFANLLSN